MKRIERTAVESLLREYRGRTEFDENDVRRIRLAAGIVMPEGMTPDHMAHGDRLFSRARVERMLRMATQFRVI